MLIEKGMRDRCFSHSDGSTWCLGCEALPGCGLKSYMHISLPRGFPTSARVFLLAVAEVLGDDAAFSDGPGGGLWVKAVQADYAAANHTPRDARSGPQRYLGWMKMRADAVLGLWRVLDRHEMASVAPPTIGGMHLVKWDGDEEE